jgi:hypothetical protein
LYPADSGALARSARVVNRTGSTEWIRNGSMIVRNGSSVVTRSPVLLVWGAGTPLWHRGSKLSDGECCFVFFLDGPRPGWRTDTVSLSSTAAGIQASAK